jgi:peptidyl-prolyl cis-trans isomerase SurA
MSSLQGQVAEQILAVVDEEIVLRSEVEAQLAYMKAQGQKEDGTLFCTILENMVTAKLLLAKARLDSLKVSDEQVEGELEQRISAMVRQLGSQEELERIYRKSTLALKLDLRPEIKEQLLIEEQRKAIFAKTNVTPQEVRRFFSQQPADSLPYLPAEVEISHIVLKPQASEKSIQKARQELQSIRQRIVSGQDKFEHMAGLYSQDYGSGKNGGSLGEFSRGEMVPEFEEVAYNMKPGEISDVFRSPFGFHIIKLTNRTTNTINASHILIRPEIEREDIEKVQKRLNQIRAAILKDSINFEKASAAFSEDVRSKDGGGRVTMPNGDFRIPLDQLDADLYLTIDQMKPGQISEPKEFIATQGELSKAYRIIWLKRRLPPHRANLNDDYQKFYQATLNKKKSGFLKEWLEKTRKQIYVEIKNSECSQALQNWN